MKAKKEEKEIKKKREKPLKINATFEEVIKIAVTTPKKKVLKKK